MNPEVFATAIRDPQVERVVKDNEASVWMILAAPAGVSAALMINAGASPAAMDNLMPNMNGMPLPYEQVSMAGDLPPIADMQDSDSNDEDPLLCKCCDDDDDDDDDISDSSSPLNLYVPADGMAMSPTVPIDDRTELKVHGVVGPFQVFKNSYVSGDAEHFGNIGTVSLSGTPRTTMHPTNQDDFFVARTPEKLIAGVFDGHSLHGHVVSSVARETILDFLLASPPPVKSDSEDPLVAAFDAANKKIDSEYEDECEAGGSNAVVVTVDAAGQVECANLGDARAVVIREDGSTHDVSKDHDVHNEEERKRMEAHGAHIIKPAGYYATESQEDGGGSMIQMSRAFGDHECRKMGLIAEPERSSYQLQDQDRFIVVATDGLWDMCPGSTDGTSSSAFVGLLVKRSVELGFTPRQISLTLTQWASVNWEEHGRVDDITVIVIPVAKGQMPPVAHPPEIPSLPPTTDPKTEEEDEATDAQPQESTSASSSSSSEDEDSNDSTTKASGPVISTDDQKSVPGISKPESEHSVTVAA